MEEVNMYFVLNTKNPNGGQFYNIYVNEGKKIDLSKFDTSDIDKFYLDVKKIDDTFKKAGGLIIGRTKKIGSLTMYTLDKGGMNLSLEEEKAYLDWLELDRKSNELYDRLTEIQNEKTILSNKIKRLRKEM